MLVLSRRIEEKIILPTVPAAIKVIAAQNGQARLGIEAPNNIPILREELCPALVLEASPPGEANTPPHTLRNRLNNVIMGVALLRLRLKDLDEELRVAVEGMSQELEIIRQCLACRPPEQKTAVAPLS